MLEKINKRLSENKKLIKAYERIEMLFSEINKKDIPPTLIEEFSQSAVSINKFNGSDQKLSKLIIKEYREILKKLEKELKIVAKNHYQNMWLAIGMSAFGLPLGVIIFAFTQNAAFIAIGIPIGLPIGLAIGAAKDKEAEKEGRQIQIDEI